MFYEDGLPGWNFHEQDLAGASFYLCDVTGANFAGANLTNVTFGRALVAGADFTAADLRNAVNLLAIESAAARNAIWSNGHIRKLSLEAGDKLIVRDYDPPGQSPRPVPIAVEQAMNVESDGLLHVLLDSDAWDSTISFQPGISVTLGGELELAFAVGVDPAAQIGRTFDLFDWTGVNPAGTFNVVSDYEWDTSRLYTTGRGDAGSGAGGGGVAGGGGGGVGGGGAAEKSKRKMKIRIRKMIQE